MPYKDKAKRTEAVRRHRAKRRAAAAPVPAVIPPFPSDPAGELAAWSRDVLKVPAGHPRAGEPMVLPDYGVAFIRDAMTHRESFCCIGRKNSKSAIVAVYLLARLAGPLRDGGIPGRGLFRQQGKGRRAQGANGGHRPGVGLDRASVPAFASAGARGVGNRDRGHLERRQERGACQRL